MTQSFIIGTQGNQPFKIKSDYVSREHARIDIDDNGLWTITDLNSTNGTFLRNEDTGEMTRICQMVITPLSFICLGPNNTKGCTFYACHLLTPDKYDKELAYMNQKEDEYEERLRRIDNINKVVNVLVVALPIAIFIILMLLWGMNSETMVIRMVALSLIPSAMKLFFKSSTAKKKLAQRYDNFRLCPNPTCAHKLKSEEIRAYDCAHCHC